MAIERPERLRKPSSGMAPELKFLLTSLSPIQCMDCRFAFISGWMMFKLRPIFDNNNRKIVNFVKSKNIFSSFDLIVSENWPLVSQCRCQNDSQCLVFRVYASSWARNLSVCLCSFGQERLS